MSLPECNCVEGFYLSGTECLECINIRCKECIDDTEHCCIYYKLYLVNYNCIY